MAHTDPGPTTYPLGVADGLAKRGSTPIRIAQVVGKVVMSGVDQVVMNYYRHIDRSKVQFDFYMDGLAETPLDEEIRALGGEIVKLPAYEDSLRKNVAAFRAQIRERGYEVVHSHMNTLSGIWLREAKSVGVPVRIAHSHSTAVLGERKRALLKYTLRPFAKMYATEYMACAQHAGVWQFGSKAFTSGRVRLIRNAIDVEKFERNQSIRQMVRNELGMQDKYIVGHVGRFEYAKNHEFLIEVFERVQDCLPDAMLLLVGDGQLRSDIEALCRRKGLSGRVVFAGVRTDVSRLLQAMDCFVFPSHFEGLGLAVIEAQAAGLPCIISENVPDEAVVTTSCASLSLHDPVSMWAHEVCRLVRSKDSPTESAQAVRAAGYCIREAAPRLASLYLQLTDEVRYPRSRAANVGGQSR